MSNKHTQHALGKFPLGALCNAHPDIHALHSSVTPLFKGACICGPAKTAKIPKGQNAAIHRAVHTAAPGDVLVVAAGGDTSFGPFGDILATCCQQKGVQGLVIDSTVRDTADILALGFPVFCLGANPTATSKTDPGDIDLEVICGEVRVRPGDIIVGDDDGVVVVPRGIADEVVAFAQAVIEKERQILSRLADGQTTCEIFKITP